MQAITIETVQTEEKNPSLPKPNLIQQVGFTLIELSIVLVIIGLIVGGVLVGQDLIKAAEIRATIGQYEKYNAAMNTFRTKYNGMPGDLLAASSTAFGLDPTAGAHAGTTGLGDGNSLITDTAATNINAPVGETVLIWQQLSAASLLDGSYGTGLTTTGQLAASPTPALYLPAAKMGRGNYWIAGSSAGQNYYVLAAVTGVTTGAAATATYATTVGGGLTPVESYNIDSKLDDGAPYTGIIQARGHATMGAAADTLFPALATASRAVWSTATVASSVAGDCVTTGATATDTASTYSRGATPGSTPACTLRMRFN
jgi:prepilin-type N-terminal cleavage/methylation domain-containing protein